MALMRSRDATKGCGAQNGFLCNGNKAWTGMDLGQIVGFFDSENISVLTIPGAYD